MGICYNQLVRITAKDPEETSSLELQETWRFLLIYQSAQNNDIPLIGPERFFLSRYSTNKGQNTELFNT